MSLTTQLLSSSGYIMYNKILAKILGVNEAVLIGEFCAKYEYWLEKGDLISNNGWFFITRDDIQNDTGLTDNQQRSALQILKDNGIIEVQRKGIPSKMWYRLNSCVLDDLMSKKCTTGGLKSAQQVVEKVDDINRYTKKETKKETKEIDKSISSDQPPKNVFIKPTLEQVTAYCLERRRGVDPQKWYDHYTANGWFVGKVKMKDWRAAVRTWEKEKPRSERILE